MFREIPTSNRLLSKIWKDKEQEIHLRKLKEVKSCLNIKKNSKNLIQKLGKTSKKEKIEEERISQIEKDNKILLQKMRRIMEGSNDWKLPYEKGSLNKVVRK